MPRKSAERCLDCPPVSVEPGQHAVELVDLVKRYGARPAVDGLTASFPAAAVTALLGPNGAG